MLNRRLLAPLAAGAALMLLACGSDPGGPNGPPRLVDRVVFLNSDPQGVAALYHVAVEGGEPVRLTDGGLNVGCPRVSPDGTTIVFGSSSRLMAMDADGSNVRDLVPDLVRPEAFFVCASWSPDGTRLAVVRRVDRIKSSSTSDLFVLNADGSGVNRIAGGDLFQRAEWSPSGDKLLFSSSSKTDGGPYDFAFNVINADGTGWQRTPQRWFGADWSPDATRVAFVCGVPPVNRLCVSQWNGEGMATLTPTAMLVRDPAWAPMGEVIAFSCDQSVCTVNRDGTGLRTVASNGRLPVWSPDAKLIVYHCGTSGGHLCAVKPDASGNRTLVSLASYNFDPSFPRTD